MLLEEIYHRLDIAPYTASWKDDSLYIDFGIHQLRIRKRGNTYTMIISGKEYPTVRICQGPNEVVLVTNQLVASHQINKQLTDFIDDIDDWLPVEITWIAIEKVQVRFNQLICTISHVSGTYYFHLNGKFWSLSSFLKDIEKSVKNALTRELKSSTENYYSLLAGEYVCYGEEKHGLVWLVIKLINQTTDLIMDKISRSVA